jgi:Flp pilus assembly protein TadG
MKRDEHGTATLWVLGLCVIVLFLGGLSLDLWRVITVRRSLVAMADAGATAGADGLDPGALRADRIELDPALARADADDALRAQSGWPAVDDADVAVTPGQVTVTLQAHVSFTLLGIFVHGDPITVRVAASAQPRVDP